MKTIILVSAILLFIGCNNSSNKNSNSLENRLTRENVKPLIESQLSEQYKNKYNDCMISVYAKETPQGLATYVWDGHGDGQLRLIKQVMDEGLIWPVKEGNINKIVVTDVGEQYVIRSDYQNITFITSSIKATNIEISGILELDQTTSKVEYTYTLEPIEFTPFKSLAIIENSIQKNGSYTFKKYDDGWRIRN